MSRGSCGWLGVLGLLTMGGSAWADMGVPGFKWVQLYVSVDNLNDYPDHVFFFVVPGWLTGERISGPGRPPNPEPVFSGDLHSPGYPARFNHKWMLVAVPRSALQQADEKFTWKLLARSNPGVLHSNHVTIPYPQPVIFLRPKDYELHRFHVTLADGTLQLTPGPVETGSDSLASWIPGLALAGVVVGLGFWLVRRFRLRTPASTKASKE